MRVPKTLLNDLRSLADRFENVIRADERKRLLAKFRAETGRKPVAAGRTGERLSGRANYGR